jgi:hypothetical protein
MHATLRRPGMLLSQAYRRSNEFGENERTALLDLRNAVISFLGDDRDSADAITLYSKDLLAIKATQET